MTSPSGGSSGSVAAVSTPSFQPIPKKLQQIKTDKPRPHVCPVCTRGFARLEHLKRHERSHTNEKPFQCAACGRCFARRDLVLRHQQKLHLGLPIRNGKDENEHVIILDDNTAALAPLPHSRDQFSAKNGAHSGNPDHQIGNDGHTGLHNDHLISSGPSVAPVDESDQKPRSNSTYGDPLSQDVVFDLPQFPTPQLGVHGNSPPKQASGDTNGKPVFRTPTGAFLNSHIPSPIPTSSSHNTPGRAPLITPDTNQTGGASSDTMAFGDYAENHSQNRFRHNLYSAATAMLYLNNYDAGLIQNMQLPEVPLQVEFLTPQLNAVDDINYKSVNSVLNLATMNVDWNVEHLNLNQSANLYYLMQFLDPQHPHHLKGMTPMVEMKFDFEKLTDNGKNGADGSNGAIGNGANGMQGAADFTVPHDSTHHRSSSAEDSQNNRHMSCSTHMSVGNESSYSVGQSKKQKLLPDDFIRDIISTPFDGHFPAASHHIGFGNLPADSQQLDDILGLFRRRQLDLITGLSPPPLISENNIITEELRARILMESKLSELQFPPTIDLQNYMKLYEEEFDPCFPFVHLPMLKDPIVDNFDNIPLVLAMATIGALYLFHDRNAILLFNLLKLLLNQYFERELVGVTDSWKFKKVSITTHQCLVLHIFITIFINQDGMADTSARLISSMARLVHLTGFDKPLELLLVPPELLSGAAHDPNVIRKNYDYFIMAQLRIRTLHTFYLLQVFRAAVLGQPAPMSADALGSGLFCLEEEMWQCVNLTQWFGMVSSSNKLNIISLSNSKSFSNLLIELHNHYTDMVIPLRTVLSILFYVHQKIQGTIRQDAMQWRFQERPQLEALLKSWELMYIKAGGVLSVTASNQVILKKHKELRLILPSYYYARLKLCVNVVPILQNVWSRNWNEMNTKSFAILSQDPEALLEATQLAVDIINVWVHNISVANDAKSTSIRTPVFFVTVVFAAILVISHFLFQCEANTSLTAFERLLWLKCESIIRQSEGVLSYNVNADKDKKSLLERDIVRREIQISGEVNSKVEQLKLAELSLEVGTRILTDAPVWPLAMRFAEGLKQRRNYLMKRASSKI